MAPRVVVVVGTESGYTRMAMNKTIKGWKAGGVDVKQENVLEGSAAPKTAEEFAELAKNFDPSSVPTLRTCANDRKPLTAYIIHTAHLRQRP